MLVVINVAVVEVVVFCVQRCLTRFQRRHTEKLMVVAVVDRSILRLLYIAVRVVVWLTVLIGCLNNFIFSLFADIETTLFVCLLDSR